MLNITFIKRIEKSEAGFTFIELLIGAVMTIMILGLLAHLFRSQQKSLDTQTTLNTLQANGRGATEFVSRSVQNAGFNVKRGTRFLSASDHYLTAVHDENNDNTIQNNEVVTFTIANVWSGSANESFSFVSWFDVDGDGVIDSSENPTVNVEMTTSGPPFNLYKVIPNPDGTDIERSLVARNIDNMVIKYYDRNGSLLPILDDTDGDGIGDVAFDANDDGVPDDGNWFFRIPLSELNDIRKVEIEVLARSRKPSPRDKTSSGNYTQGSFAAEISGSTAYSDKYNREDFTARMSPRNLVMAPWGSVPMLATPVSVDCPSTSTVMATLLDTNGDPISGETINFTATGAPSITINPTSVTSDLNGEGTTLLAYDFKSPYLTTTISGSALVNDGSGNLVPIYNATPVGFSFGGEGKFIELFDGSQTMPWEDLAGGTLQFDDSAGYFVSTEPQGTNVGALNGCNAWKDYSVQTNLMQKSGSPWAFIDHMGIILRHTDSNNYYFITLRNIGGIELRIWKLIGGSPWPVTSGGKTMTTIPDIVNTPVAFQADFIYTLKAQISGTDIRVKLWRPADPNDPNASEPVLWEIGGGGPDILNPLPLVTDSEFTSGNFGVLAMDSIFQFDNVILNNPEPIL